MRSRAWLSLPLLLVLAACRVPVYTPEEGRRVLAEVGQRVTTEAYADRVDFRTWPRMLEAQQGAVEAARDRNAFAGAVNRALDGFKVSHLRLRTPEAARERARNRVAGALGFAAILEAGTWVVMQVFPESPAWEAGMRPGDGLDLPASATPAQVFAGPGPHRVAWTREGQRFEGTLTRRGLALESGPTLRWLRPDVAWMRVPSFRPGLYDPDRAEALFAQCRGAATLVLDLRGNGGGLLSSVGHLLSRLLPEGTRLYAPIGRREVVAVGMATAPATAPAAQVAQRLGRWSLSRPGPQGPFTGRVLVLVDALNGSGGELAPAILQDHQRAEVLGMKTPGAVLGAQDRRLGAGWELQVPLLEVVTGGGRTLEGKGVVPDHPLSAREVASTARVEAAVLRVLVAQGTRPPVRQGDGRLPCPSPSGTMPTSRAIPSWIASTSTSSPW